MLVDPLDNVAHRHGLIVSYDPARPETTLEGLTKLKPIGGFCAETSAALTLFANSYLGIPVSTTHTITGAIMGVGATQRLSAVRWGVATRIIWAWLLTIPFSALMAALTFKALGLFLNV